MQLVGLDDARLAHATQHVRELRPFGVTEERDRLVGEVDYRDVVSEIGLHVPNFSLVGFKLCLLDPLHGGASLLDLGVGLSLLIKDLLELQTLLTQLLLITEHIEECLAVA